MLLVTIPPPPPPPPRTGSMTHFVTSNDGAIEKVLFALSGANADVTSEATFFAVLAKHPWWTLD